MSFPPLRDTSNRFPLPSFQRKYSHQNTAPVLPPEKLYLLLPNHQCPNKKNCPFHPPEEQEEEAEEGPELAAPVNKKRALSLASWEDQGASEKLLAEKLAKINQQISSRLEESHKLHLPRKTSHDINMPDPGMRSEFSVSTETIVAASTSTREQSVASDYESTLTLDSGVMFDSCSDREMEEDEPLPLIQEEVVVPDVALPEELELKDGEPLTEEVNHKATFKEGEATLQIHTLSTEDAGTYTCQAVNSLGEAETSAEINVEEVRHRRKRMEDEEASVRYIRPLNQYDTTMVDTNIAPEFTLPLVDQSRAVGDEVTFTVTVTCRPEPDVKWYHGQEEMVRSSRVSFQHEKGVYRMTVLDLDLKDAGEWKCKAVNSYGEAWCSCDLKVIEQVPAGHTRPRFTKELEYMTVTQGSLVRLECTVVGDPAPGIKWYKDRLRIDVSDRHYKIRHYDDGKVTTATLVIESSEVEDGGMYMCVAENSAGSVSSEGKIRVQKVYDDYTGRESLEPYEKPSRDESPIKKSRVEVAPDFTAKLKNKSAAEGATVRLNCSVTGIPEPSVRWFRDGQEIFDGHDYTMRNNYGLLSLEIVYAKKALSGKYTVEASNSQGTVSCSCTLDVEGDEELDAIEADFLRPKFITKIQDIYVNEGGDATFTCTATGKPMPIFKWQRDNITITGSKRIQSEYDNQGHTTLTLKDVKVTDAGLYYCVAQSRAGRVKCSAYLHVKAKSPSPVTEPPAYRKAGQEVRSSRERSEAKGAPPTFALPLPSSVDVAVGDRLKLDCSVQGYPIPLVTWHKGDRELMYSQRHRIILCGTLHTMEIPQTMALDKGHYIVRATNVHGTVETSCFVNTLAAGEKVRTPPDYRRDAMRDAARGNLQEESPEQEEPEPPRKRAKAPFFIKHLPRTIDVMEGIDVRLDCILRRGIELVRWSSSRSPSQEQDQERQLKKELADEGFTGEFIPLKDEKKPEADGRIEHPSFLATPTDLVRPVGSEAVFECATAATDPEPEVKWYKDGRTLLPSDGVRMTSAGNKHKLKIKAILESDAGQYTCKATSSAGSDSCSATLTIADDSSPRRPSKAQAIEEEEKKAKSAKPAESTAKSKIEASEKAVFSQDLPKSVSTGQGEEVELLCQLSSSAEVAGVRWELDGRELPPEARYVVSRDEDTLDQRLTVQNASPQDSGKYTCVVTFKDGDLIHTSTSLTINAKEPSPPAKEEEDFKPHFSSTLSDLTLQDGDELVLECDIQGNPRPQISWIRDGVEIFDSQDFQISMIGDHCKLQIADVYPEDEGKYSCKAVNMLGEATTSCFVTVEADLSIAVTSQLAKGHSQVLAILTGQLFPPVRWEHNTKDNNTGSQWPVYFRLLIVDAASFDTIGHIVEI
ncbi:titin [Plakobranchus ocellatus]|uniref:Titin n=1 Tax=Plakobranchus ocellatus TaxID=259542 RepID=A0AAV4D2Y8_9GAST|nr:titin [Plakobranchus ocellatus]